MACNRMRRHGSPQELERVRREAVALAAQGVSRLQIAAAFDRSVHTVNKWLALARRQGPDALAATPHPGRQPKVSVRQRQWLRRQTAQRGAGARLVDRLVDGRAGAGIDLAEVWRRISCLLRSHAAEGSGLDATEARTPGARTERSGDRALGARRAAADQKKFAG